MLYFLLFNTDFNTTLLTIKRSSILELLFASLKPCVLRYVLSIPPVVTSEVFPCLCVCVCLSLLAVVACVSQQHSDVSVLEFHLERTPLLTSPHPPELTGQSVPPLDFTSSMLSVCYTLWFACLCLSVLLSLYLKAGLLTVMRKGSR